MIIEGSTDKGDFMVPPLEQLSFNFVHISQSESIIADPSVHVLTLLVDNRTIILNGTICWGMNISVT